MYIYYIYYIYHLCQYFYYLQKYSQIIKKSDGNKNNKKTFSIKMWEDVRDVKTQKVCKQGQVNVEPKIKQTTFIFYITLHKYLHCYKARQRAVLFFIENVLCKV